MVACAGGDGGGDPLAFRVTVDTVAGVETVRSAGVPPRFQLDSTATISTADGNELGRVTGVVGDWRGGIYVADGDARRVYRYDGTGAYEGALGASGSRAGEFREMRGLAWVAGRLASLDAGNGRITLLAADGKDAPQSVPWRPPATGMIVLEQPRPGEAYAPVALAARPGASASRAYIRLIGNGAPDTLPAYGEASTGTGSALCEALVRGIPFASIDLAIHGVEHRTVIANSGAYRLALLDAAGDTLRIIERDQPPLPISDMEWTRAEGEWRRVAQASQTDSCTLPDTVRPAVKPAFRGAFWDDRGRLWVEASAPEGFRLDVFDTTGALVGELPAPERDPSVPMSIRGGRLYWVTVDSSGAHAVRAGRLDEEPRAAEGMSGSP